MFTDMVGFTAMMQDDEHRAKSVRDRHRETLRKTIEKHGGEIIQFYGDGTLSIFPSAIDAVASAVEAQQALQQDPVIPVRIGLHIGDIIRDENGIYGDGVNVAARVEGLSVPGAVMISGKVFDEIKNHPELPATALGEFDLKNVRRPIRIFAIAAPGLVVPDPKSMSSRTGPPEKTIAVLPFVNMSADPENEFFSDGISEEIINTLTRLEGLQVTARTSSFAFKGKNKDVRDIGRKLGVSAVLEGSVRKAGNRVRITAQLIDTRDGYHIFSKVYDRVLEDIFATQDEISLEIANELRATLPGPGNGEKPSLVRKATEHSEAYDAYLKGMYCWNQWTPDSARQAIEHFQHAIELDPEFAQAWGALARSHTYLAAMGRAAQCGEAYVCASHAAERAIELDPDIEDSHVALALVRLFSDWDRPASEESFLRAMEINPDSVDVLHGYSLLLQADGRAEEAIAMLERATALDPLSLPVLDYLGKALMACDRHEEALTQFDRVLELDPEFRSALEGKGWAYLHMGRLDDAIATFERVRELTPHPKGGITPLAHALGVAGREAEAEELIAIIEEREREEPGVALDLDLATAYSGLGREEETMRHVRLAADKRIGSLIFLRNWPSWAPIRQMSGFEAFMEEYGL
jgi:TolB-like protein/tetratricopeptide (TPR) repeat protein